MLLNELTLISLLFSVKVIDSVQYSYSDLLPTDYNRDIAPKVGRQPVRVNVSMVVLTVKPDLNAEMVTRSLFKDKP